MRGKYFWGIVLILLGAGFLLDQFELMSFGALFRDYWPVILILLGLIGLLDRRSSKFGNLLLIVIGIIFQIDRLNLLEGNAFKLLWPIILILVGLKVILGGGSIIIDTDNSEKKTRFKGNITLENSFDETVILSAMETNIQSRDFRGGRATAILGGLEIDLSGARIHNNEAIIDVTAILGGVEIYVPHHWRVEVSGTPILGGWSNKTKINNDPNAPVLKVRCFVLFGGMEVK